MAPFRHVSVLLRETVDALAPRPDGVYLDCTLGGGGHSEELLKRLTTGRLVAVDRDADAIENAKIRFAPYGGRVTLVHDNFVNVDRILAQYAPDGIDGAMIDLGVSSHQLDTPGRGFSYHADAPLDMRMDQSAPLSAFEVVNTYTEAELARILFTYGEEKRARAVAAAIVRAREKKEIATTLELAEVIRSVFPPKERAVGKHPARRSFQAIRIEVNGELAVIPETLKKIVPALKPGGRLAVITFHSLEDRAVKDTLLSFVNGCTCPPDFPVCVCGFVPTLRLVTRKPVEPSPAEQEENPRSRSAKLRIAEKR